MYKRCHLTHPFPNWLVRTNISLHLSRPFPLTYTRIRGRRLPVNVRSRYLHIVRGGKLFCITRGDIRLFGELILTFSARPLRSRDELARKFIRRSTHAIGFARSGEVSAVKKWIACLLSMFPQRILVLDTFWEFRERVSRYIRASSF